MYVCMYVCMYTYTYTCIHIHVCIYIYMYVHVYIYTYSCIGVLGSYSACVVWFPPLVCVDSWAVLITFVCLGPPQNLINSAGRRGITWEFCTVAQNWLEKNLKGTPGGVALGVKKYASIKYREKPWIVQIILSLYIFKVYAG